MTSFKVDENLLFQMSKSTVHVHKVTFALAANFPKPKNPKNFIQGISEQYERALEEQLQDSPVLIGEIGNISEVRKLTTNVRLPYSPMFILWTITELDTGKEITAGTVHDLYVQMLKAFGEVPILSLIDIASYMRPGDELTIKINNRTYTLEVRNA